MSEKNELVEAVKAGLYEIPEVIIDDLDNFYRNWLDAGRQQLAAGEPAGLIDATLDKIEGLLGAVGTGFVRASAGISGYPYP